MNMRGTHTFVLMELSESAYAEVATALRDAGYDHAFGEAGALDMQGIAVTKVAAPTHPLPVDNNAGAEDTRARVAEFFEAAAGQSQEQENIQFFIDCAENIREAPLHLFAPIDQTTELERLRKALEDRIKELYHVVDPLNPAPAGSYNRGYQNGIAYALQEVRQLIQPAVKAEEGKREREFFRDAPNPPDAPPRKTEA